MSNSYFRFKQFTIVQEQGAMKVTTDACIQGAWTPVLPRVKHALDIGAGTGLLSLMLTQRNPKLVTDAIELDAAAAQEADANVQASPWKDNIHVVCGDVRSYALPRKYDLIISNPPFFNNSLLGKEDSKNIARHTLSLSYAALLEVLEQNLAVDGYVSILLPAAEYEQWHSMAITAGWAESRRLSVRHSVGAAVKRVVGIFCKSLPAPAIHEELIIADEHNQYTKQFIDLLSPFYLNL